jgi:transcriptional regulator with XRE-family HTH domain
VFSSDFLRRDEKESMQFGMTLAEVAERMKIDPPALSRLETGKMLNSTLATLHKWAEALGRKLDVELSPA